MLIPKKNRLAILQYLFREGVLVTKKDPVMTPHMSIEVPNLHVCKLMLSLKSKGLVNERYCWRYLYYTLNDKGVDYLREYLHLPAETVPATQKKATKASTGPTLVASSDRGDRPRREGGREGYRSEGGFSGRGRGGFRRGGGRAGGETSGDAAAPAETAGDE